MLTPALALALAATGVVDTNFSCHAKGGFMYGGLPVGTVASLFSLGTNLAATVLTAYKAWFVALRSHPSVHVQSRSL